jgi:hypothetical protein
MKTKIYLLLTLFSLQGLSAHANWYNNHPVTVSGIETWCDEDFEPDTIPPPNPDQW